MRDILVHEPLRLELQWSRDEVWWIKLGWAGQGVQEESRWESPFAGEVADIFRDVLRGERPDVSRIPLAWRRVEGFSRAVLQALYHRVDFGEWISYSGLAHICGVPGGARAVGRVMGKNPWPLLVPCHRVLRRDGQIGGFSSGIELKRYLLGKEGVLAGDR